MANQVGRRMKDEPDYIAAGWSALQAAHWLEAKQQFEAALQQGDTPEARDGLGLTLWWLNDIRAAHEQRTAAYLGYKKRREYRHAAMLATWLAREQVFLSSNTSAMNGWFARAERLLQQVEPCVEQGWFALFRASLLASPAELEQTALEAFQIARQFDDADLEAIALAFSGTARVALGQVDRRHGRSGRGHGSGNQRRDRLCQCQRDFLRDAVHV